MSLKNLNQFSGSLKSTEKLPTLFLGHGSPMNAIEENEFVKGWRKSAENMQMPSAVLCVSAHWETIGTHVTAMESPRTIHDFYGFPQQLYQVQYPAPGCPELAEQTKQTIKSTDVELDHSWGLDHGSWSVVKHLFPNADVPVLQLSLDRTKNAAYHYELAKELKLLRRKGVLIVGSGNMVHNLRMLDWHNQEGGYDWALEANAKLKSFILENNFNHLTNYESLGSEFKLSIPTPEHYLPLLYVMALQEDGEQVNFFNDKTVMGSISMTSLKIDSAS